MNDLGWVDALNGEPLRLSDEQLRNELDIQRNNLSVVHTAIPYQNSAYSSIILHKTIHEFGLILNKPDLDSKFWISLLESKFHLQNYFREGVNISLNLISHIVFCALLGRTSYQDLDGSYHIPLYYPTTSYVHYFAHVNQDIKHLVEWRETNYPFDEISLDIKESNSLVFDRKWIDLPLDHSLLIMLLIIFENPTQLERVILKSPGWNKVFQENQIFSIEFMDLKIYGIFPNSQIRDLVHLSEILNANWVNLPSPIVPGSTPIVEIEIDIDSYPQSIPKIHRIYRH